MKRKKIFLLLTVFLAINFVMFLGTNKVEAATGVSGNRSSGAKIWLGSKGKTWNEGILTIDGRIAFCADYTKRFESGLIMTSMDALTYFKQQGLSETQAQELLNEVSLYSDYLYKERQDLTDEQRYFFGQTLIWNTMNKYFRWTNREDDFWIHAWTNTSLFPCKTEGDACLATNTEYQQQLYAAARQYYQANKLVYTGEGTVWVSGANQPLMEFDVMKLEYDYSYQASCATCENTNADNLAYTIKDTSNWNGIIASTASDNSNIAGYFYEGGNVLCREEFSVYFPNADDKIYVEPGRYFILNPEQYEIANLSHFGATSIPNMKPFKVYRKRECRTNLVQGEKESTASFIARQRAALSSYESSKKRSFASDMGTMWFRYTETYEDSKYSMDEPDEMQLYRVYARNPLLEYKSGMTTSGKTVQLTMENTTKYKLPENYYRYIRLSDGLSMHKPDSSGYKDVGIANLPVSFENHGVKIDATRAKAADIQFAYDLPANAKISSAANNSGYLATSKGNGGSGGSCIAKSSILGDPTDEYSCEILTSYDPDGPGDGCKTAADAKELGLDWNSKGGYCCPPGTTYNAETGKCDSGPSDDCDTEEDADRLGLDWNPNMKACCPAGTKYNPSTGNCEGEPSEDDDCKTEEDAKKLGVDWNPVTKACCPAGTKYNPETGKCLKGNETDPVCPTSECPYGCCPSGECAPMPTINGEPYCPGPGGVDVIYRTIDLEDPFPGQAADKRNTGSNWCSYSNGVYSCKYDNLTVKNYITREKSNGKKDGSKVYSDSHVLYEVKLDTSTIKAIRSYNDKNKYDDWNLKCASSSFKFSDGNVGNGRACESDFLKGTELSGNISGLCYPVDTNNFYSCDKDV